MLKLLNLTFILGTFFFLNASTTINDFYYEKNISKKNIHEIIAKKNWKNKTNKLSFGYSLDTYWIKFNVSLDKESKYLILNEYILDYLDIYVVNNKNILKVYHNGMKQKTEKNFGEYRKSAVFLDSKKFNSYEIYINTSSSNYVIGLLPEVLSQEEFLTLKAYDNTILSIYFFILVLMLLFNLIIYYLTKLSYYKEYLVYLLCLIIVTLFTSNFFHIYFMKDGLSDIFLFLFQSLAILMIFVLLKLVKHFLIMSRTSNKVFKYTFFIVFTFFILNWYIKLLGFSPLILFFYLNLLLLVFLFMFISFFILKKIFKFDIFSFLIALIWLPLIFNLIFFLVNMNYLLVSNIIIGYITNLLFIYESIFISLLLAYYIKILERNKREVEKELYLKENTLLRVSKFASMGEMLNNIAHQWKQPLSRINSIVFKSRILLEEKKDPFLKYQLELIENETSYMSNTISGLLSYFHINKKEESFNLYALVVKQKQFLSNLEFKIKLEVCVLDKSITTNGYKNEYEQVIMTIIENAIDSLKVSSKENPKIKISIFEEDTIPVLKIENNGVQIKKEHLNRVFEPYFTTKNSNTNYGIGLYMSKMLIEESMGKSLEVRNSSYGVEFKIKG